jgi:hypothetical protein
MYLLSIEYMNVLVYAVVLFYGLPYFSYYEVMYNCISEV